MNASRHVFAIVLPYVAVAAIAVAASAWLGGSYAVLITFAAAFAAGIRALRSRAADTERFRTALSSAVTDATRDERARADAAEDAAALRDEILSTLNEGVMLVEGGRVAYTNAAARTLLRTERLSPHPAVVPLPESDEPVERSVTLHHPEHRELQITSIPAGADRLLVVVQDVTEAKRIDDVRRDFVANASHEMKTPVAAILATAETLKDAVEHDPPAAKRFVDTLVRDARRLTDLVNDLLDLARLEQPASMPSAPVDLGELVARCVEAARPRCEERRLTLRSESAEDIHVAGRSEDLTLVVGNLLDNAIRYNRPRGSIEVILTRRGDDAVLDVVDSGVGIPQKDLPRIFERFFRVDEARSRESGGTGLGLAIVRHVVETHGGSITARSELGKGSTFSVSLPLVPSRTI